MTIHGDDGGIWEMVSEYVLDQHKRKIVNSDRRQENIQMVNSKSRKAEDPLHPFLEQI